MAFIIHIENQERTSIDIKAEELMRETKVLNIARLAKMLVVLFGIDDVFKKVGKYEGEEVELHLVFLR